jgi:hypothetical protein
MNFKYIILDSGMIIKGDGHRLHNLSEHVVVRKIENDRSIIIY